MHPDNAERISAAAVHVHRAVALVDFAAASWLQSHAWTRVRHSGLQSRPCGRSCFSANSTIVAARTTNRMTAVLTQPTNSFERKTEPLNRTPSGPGVGVKVCLPRTRRYRPASRRGCLFSLVATHDLGDRKSGWSSNAACNIAGSAATLASVSAIQRSIAATRCFRSSSSLSIGLGAVNFFSQRFEARLPSCLQRVEMLGKLFDPPVLLINPRN